MSASVPTPLSEPTLPAPGQQPPMAYHPMAMTDAASPPSVHLVRAIIKCAVSTGASTATDAAGQPVAALIDACHGTTLLYKDMEARVQGAAEVLGGAGQLRRGQVMGTYLRDAVTQKLALYGGMVLGVVVGLIPSPGTADEVAAGLRAIKPEVLLVQAELLPSLRAGLAQALKNGYIDPASAPRLIVVRSGASDVDDASGQLQPDQADVELPEGTVSINLLDARSSNPLTIAPEVEAPEAVRKTCMLLLSSGSTGFPKAVELSHMSYAVSHTEGHAKMRKMLMMEVGTVFYASMPSSHAYIGSRTCTTGVAFPSGATTIVGVPQPGGAIGVAAAIAKYKPTVMTTYPNILSDLLYQPGLCETVDWSSMRLVVTGGSAINPCFKTDLMSRHKVPFFGGWAMTETAAGSLVSMLDRPGLIANGPSSLMDICIANPDTGELLPRGNDGGDGVEGELWVRGPALCNGYWGNAEATADLYPFGFGSWMRTGDKCFMTEKGEVILVSRFKEVMKCRGGGQVPPAELEHILREHPAILEAVVVGRPDQRFDELPVAFVVVKEGHAAPSPQEIFAFVDPRVSEYKRLAEVKFLDELPLLYSGKIDRKSLKARLY